MGNNKWFRPLSQRVFVVGDRVEWDERDLGTVVAMLDKDALAVEWDNKKLGRTMAPAWSQRLQPALSIEEETTLPMYMWEGPTSVDFA